MNFLAVKRLMILLLCAACFFTGRFLGRSDGPNVAIHYIQPPIDWQRITIHEPAIDIRAHGWHAGDHWLFKNLLINQKAHTVIGYCHPLDPDYG